VPDIAAVPDIGRLRRFDGARKVSGGMCVPFTVFKYWQA
jgi:hypothetical protein